MEGPALLRPQLVAGDGGYGALRGGRQVAGRRLGWQSGRPWWPQAPFPLQSALSEIK